MATAQGDVQSGATVEARKSVGFHEQFRRHPGAGNWGPPRAEFYQQNSWKGGVSKVYMNRGLGAKLHYTKPPDGPLRLKKSDALPIEEVWGYCLIGHYVGMFPGNKAMHDLRRTWQVASRFHSEAGWLFFTFDNSEDRDRVLQGGPYNVLGRPLLMKMMPAMFCFRKDCIAHMPIWARVHGLPKEYWTSKILGRIASHLGTPLFMDPVTENRYRGAYARVLVEVNFGKAVIRELAIQYEDGNKTMCRVEYEYEQKFCKHCCVFGHNLEGCSICVADAKNVQKELAATDVGVSRQRRVERTGSGKVDDRAQVVDGLEAGRNHNEEEVKDESPSLGLKGNVAGDAGMELTVVGDEGKLGSVMEGEKGKGNLGGSQVETRRIVTRQSAAQAQAQAQARARAQGVKRKRR